MNHGERGGGGSHQSDTEMTESGERNSFKV